MALARMCASSEEHLATITSAGGISADQAKQVFARKHVVVPHHATTFAPFDSTLACLSRLLLIETFLLRSLAGCKSHAPKAWSEQLLGTHPRGPCRHGRHLDEDWQAGRHKEKYLVMTMSVMFNSRSGVQESDTLQRATCLRLGPAVLISFCNQRKMRPLHRETGVTRGSTHPSRCGAPSTSG